MPKYPLVPFKAYFEYNHSQRISETLSNTIQERAFEKSNSITSKWFIYNFHSGFNISYLQEGTVVDLELNEIHSTSPDILHVKDYKKYYLLKLTLYLLPLQKTQIKLLLSTIKITRVILSLKMMIQYLQSSNFIFLDWLNFSSADSSMVSKSAIVV